MPMALSAKTDRRRILWLAEEDISAAMRLLSLLSSGSAGGAPAAAQGQASPKSAEAGQVLERARLSLYLRQRRIEVLGKTFAAEPPFQMLLSVYVSEDREPDLTVARLTDLSWLASTTALRWVDTLENEGWLTRTDVAEDGRKSRIHLTAKARKRLAELFTWPD